MLMGSCLVDAKRTCWLPGFPALGLAGQCALLAAITLLVGSIAAVIAYRQVGIDGVWGAVVAGVLCLTGSELALMFTRRPSTDNGLTGMLLGMMCRLGVPLVGSLLIRFGSPRLFEAGALYCLIALYLVTLTVEVGFELCNASLSRSAAGRS